MKIKAHVEAHYEEVDIDLGDMMEQMLDRRSGEDVRSVMYAISEFIGFMKRVPDFVPGGMTDGNREVISNALMDQAKRFSAAGRGEDEE